MQNRWYSIIIGLVRRTIRRLVGGWSLERKSLLFFGVALVVPIGLSFWFVLQVVADRVVKQTTRQAARDYARAEIAWRHVTSQMQKPVIPGPGSATLFGADSYATLRIHLVENPDYSTEFLMLDDQVEYVHLENSSRPGSEQERSLLTELEQSFRDQLQKLESVEEAVRIQLSPQTADSETPLQSPTESRSNLQELQPSGPPQDVETPPALAPAQIEERVRSNPEVRSVQRELERLFREIDPLLPEFDPPQNPEAPEGPAEGMPPLNPSEQEIVPPPDGGWYVYYHAIHFPTSCLQCHQRFKESEADVVPFRVVKVMIPQGQTPVASTTTLAVMIAIAMVTIAATLLVVHWVLRRIVLNPLQHLHSVSDEISRGNTDLRANIDTGDEFNELADAFNRMLRHMTEGQEKLENLNRELDLRVDQLAQANLNLYEANRLKSDFLANMSHELRTPLNSIIGFSDVLRDIHSLNKKEQKYVANIQNSGKLLLEMINDILDLAKVEAGKMQITPSAFDLDNLLEAQCDMLRALVDEKNVELRIEIGENLVPVFQDRPKLQQILTNLLSNAIKFTPDGGMILVRADILPSESFQITVADTGVGIPETDFEIIFEKFRQSNAVLQNDGLTRQYTGTGLGLSIAKELCKLLGGEIRLTSQLGTGSTFRVILPIHYDSRLSESPLA